MFHLRSLDGGMEASLLSRGEEQVVDEGRRDI